MHLILAVAAFLLGGVVASFTGVVADRIHTGHSYVRGRSHCGSCRKTLGPLELVPILSFVVSSGRCRGCGSRIPLSHLAFELVLGALYLLAYLTLGLSLPLLVFLAFLAVLSYLVRYDLRHTIVPEGASASLVVLGLLFAVLSAPALGSALIVGGAIGLAFLLLHVLSGGKAMGLGDAPVAFALALLSAGNALTGLVLSFWIGAAWGIAVLVLRRGGPRMGIEVPFVPFLAAGFLLSYFTGWNLLPL